MKPIIRIILGSKSDLDKIAEAKDVLEQFKFLMTYLSLLHTEIRIKLLPWPKMPKAKELKL